MFKTATKAANRRFRAVIFDLGGVVIKYRDPSLYKSVLKLISLNDALKRDFVAYEEGTMSFATFRRKMNELPEITKQVEERPELRSIQTMGEQGVLAKIVGDRDPHVDRAIKALRTAGYKLALCTNNGFVGREEEKGESLIDKDAASLFDVVVESCRVGARKPGGKIYQITADRLGVKCEECVFIDDLVENCEGAKAVGMKAVHLNEGNSASSMSELGDLLGDVKL